VSVCRLRTKPRLPWRAFPQLCPGRLFLVQRRGSVLPRLVFEPTERLYHWHSRPLQGVHYRVYADATAALASNAITTTSAAVAHAATATTAIAATTSATVDLRQPASQHQASLQQPHLRRALPHGSTAVLVPSTWLVCTWLLPRAIGLDSRPDMRQLRLLPNTRIVLRLPTHDRRRYRHVLRRSAGFGGTLPTDVPSRSMHPSRLPSAQCTRLPTNCERAWFVRKLVLRPSWHCVRLCLLRGAGRVLPS
jgi:hypothetical protein